MCCGLRWEKKVLQYQLKTNCKSAAWMYCTHCTPFILPLCIHYKVIKQTSKIFIKSFFTDAIVYCNNLRDRYLKLCYIYLIFFHSLSRALSSSIGFHAFLNVLERYIPIMEQECQLAIKTNAKESLIQIKEQKEAKQDIYMFQTVIATGRKKLMTQQRSTIHTSSHLPSTHSFG